MLQISSPLYVTFLLNSGDTNISENCLLCKFKESLISFRDKTRIHLSQVKWTPVSTVHQQPVSLPPCLFLRVRSIPLSLVIGPPDFNYQYQGPKGFKCTPKNFFSS